LPAPKQQRGYRIVHQLDPIDSLIYTALVYEIAEKLEEKRSLIAGASVCSYRIDLDEKRGNFFARGNGYEEFKNKSLEFAKIYSYVLATDITDFYNQISHHRIRNALASCGNGLEEHSHNIEKFLSRLTNRTSKGVPVGPAASIILSEALLIDVDEFLLNRHEGYVRYVDDFRLFSNSRESLEDTLYALVRYLYANHRLTLAGHKTEILASDNFIEQYIENHEEVEREAIHSALGELRIQIGDYPDFEPEDLVSLSEGKVKAQGMAFSELIDKIIAFDVLDLGLARHIIRRARRLKTRVILKPLITNFDFFVPVIRDTVIYFESVLNNRAIENHMDLFENLVRNSNVLRFDYVAWWMGQFFAATKPFSQSDTIRDYVMRQQSVRPRALFAVTNEKVSWVRDFKDRYNDFGPWERRAIIYSAQILSRDERTHWMDSVMLGSDLVDRSLAMYIKSKE